MRDIPNLLLFLLTIGIKATDIIIRIKSDVYDYMDEEKPSIRLILSVLYEIFDIIALMWMLGCIVSDFSQRCEEVFDQPLDQPAQSQLIETANRLRTMFIRIKQKSGYCLFLVFTCFTINLISYAFIGNCVMA